MAARKVEEFRNVALVGHAGAGKTTLGEAVLLKAGVTNRLGSVEDGSSLLDYDEESKAHQHSVEASIFHVDDDGTTLNMIDTPGTPDYVGQALPSFIGADTAIVTISATDGIGVNTRRMFSQAGSFGLARMIAVTRIAGENVNLEELYNGIHETFGHHCRAINLPADGAKRVIDVLKSEEGAADFHDVAAAHTELVEAIVETDEELMEAYMGGGAVAPETLGPAIRRAVSAGTLIPVLFVDAGSDVGVKEFMDAVVTFAPSPKLAKKRDIVEGEGDEAKRTSVESDPAGPFVGQVLKVLADPKSNIKYTLARVFSGTLKPDGNLVVRDDRKGSRPGHFFKFRGDQHEEIPEAVAGDIVGIAKLDAKVGDMLWDRETDGTLESPKFPTPMYSLAIEPKARGDAEKISQALHRFADEDPCFDYHRDSETGELLMSGVGDQHLAAIQGKMKRYYKLEIITHPPKIPYRETIAGATKYVEYTHKKQSGGAGQFARVFIDMEPTERGEGYEFVDKIFGGSIDQQYRPAVDKGVQDQMRRGVIAGCPVIDVRVALVDGKTHPVDSKDVAFQIAGRQVFKKAFMQCKPILLEPVVKLEVTVPTDYMGDIQRDLPSKRGQITGQEMLPGGQVVIMADVPLAEVSAYASQLKSMTAGQGSYLMEFSRYDVVPSNVQQEIMKAYQAEAKDEEE